jgi:hypothetical protein
MGASAGSGIDALKLRIASASAAAMFAFNIPVRRPQGLNWTEGGVQ